MPTAPDTYWQLSWGLLKMKTSYWLFLNDDVEINNASLKINDSDIILQNNSIIRWTWTSNVTIKSPDGTKSLKLDNSWLKVTGDTTIKSTNNGNVISIWNAWTSISGTTSIHGRLDVDQRSSFTNGLGVSSGLSVNNWATINWATINNGWLNVNGYTYLSGHVSIQWGVLNIYNNTMFDKDTTVSIENRLTVGHNRNIYNQIQPQGTRNVINDSGDVDWLRLVPMHLNEFSTELWNKITCNFSTEWLMVYYRVDVDGTFGNYWEWRFAMCWCAIKQNSNEQPKCSWKIIKDWVW